MAVEKLNTDREIDVNPYLIEILMDKINQLIDEIEWWKKAHIKLQEQFIECKETQFKKTTSLKKAFDNITGIIDFDGNGVGLKKKVRKEKRLKIC